METDVWREIGDGVFVRSYEAQRLNIGLVVGSRRCLVVDTRSTLTQGRELARAVREVTSRRWIVANTHAHWDHCFGNAEFLPADIWGHRRCVTMLDRYGPIQRDAVAAQAVAEGDRGFAGEIAEVAITPPTRTMEVSARVDLGGRSVRLRHLGLGHTDNDVVVEVPDAEVVFAGDLVEEGEPPAFEDAFPLDWPATLARLASLARGPVVPGHGAVVDSAYVARQAEWLTSVADGTRTAHAGGRDPTEAARKLPLPEPVARYAALRAYRQLDGAPAYDPPADVRAALGLPPA